MFGASRRSIAGPLRDGERKETIKLNVGLSTPDVFCFSAFVKPKKCQLLYVPFLKRALQQTTAAQDIYMGGGSGGVSPFAKSIKDREKGQDGAKVAPKTIDKGHPLSASQQFVPPSPAPVQKQEQLSPITNCMKSDGSNDQIALLCETYFR
uniref:Uncharacterized protein n=1 Tax=Romanomermis culicivorax TaxID=13658 RepID=A0A915HIC4_ROMCU